MKWRKGVSLAGIYKGWCRGVFDNIKETKWQIDGFDKPVLKAFEYKTSAEDALHNDYTFYMVKKIGNWLKNCQSSQ